MTVLTAQALKGIASYKYKSGTYTWIDNAMTPYWNWAVTLLPMWMAPNLVTLIGVGLILSSTFIACLYSQRLDEEFPAWVSIYCALALFLYQTLDAIDGKQARRTGSASPLGQLFDHGCDALCVVFNMLGAACAVGFGASWRSLALLFAIAWPFYLAQWDEYHTGTMSTGNGYFGVTEGQLILVLVHLCTAVGGHAVWRFKPFAVLPNSLLHLHEYIGHLGVDDILFTALCVSNLILCLSSIFNVIHLDSNHMDAAELGHKKIGGVGAFLQIIPMFLLFVLGMLWTSSGPAFASFAEYPSLYFIALGIGFVFITTRMIIAHMSKVPFPKQFLLIVPLVAAVAMVYLPSLGLSKFSILSPNAVMVLFLVYMVSIYLYHVVFVVREICAYLHIDCFKIHIKTK